MGFESDKDNVSAVGIEEEIISAFAPSLEEYVNCQVCNQETALKYITSRVCYPSDLKIT